MTEKSEVKNTNVAIFGSELEAAAGRVAERALNKSVDGVSGLIGDVFGGWIGDSIQQWRTRRLVACLIETKTFLEARGIPLENAKSLPMGEVFSIFDGASKQEDVSLTHMWASLLASGMDPHQEVLVEPSFYRILGSMSGLDALIVEFIIEFEEFSKKYDDILRIELSKIEDIEKRSNIRSCKLKEFSEKIRSNYSDKFAVFTEDQISYSLFNLLRIGIVYIPTINRVNNGGSLISIEMKYGDMKANSRALERVLNDILSQLHNPLENKKNNLKLLYPSTGYTGDIDQIAFALTGLGRRFVAACRPPVDRCAF